MEGGYGTTSADREKVVSTLVIENVNDPPAITLARSQLPDDENVRLWLPLVGSKEEPCATLTERPRDRKGSI
jgi:hypothetical protein